MNTDRLFSIRDTKSTLSTLWIFLLLNVIFRDIHEFFRPGFLAEVMTGTVNGNEMTAGMLLVAGMLLEIPIAMVILSRILRAGANRWANIVAAVLTVAFMLVNAPQDLDDWFFAAVEIVTLISIVWLAWRWPTPQPDSDNPKLAHSEE